MSTNDLLINLVMFTHNFSETFVISGITLKVFPWEVRHVLTNFVIPLSLNYMM